MSILTKLKLKWRRKPSNSNERRQKHSSQEHCKKNPTIAENHRQLTQTKKRGFAQRSAGKQPAKLNQLKKHRNFQPGNHSAHSINQYSFLAQFEPHLPGSITDQRQN